jgi:hypothetical protein
MQIVMRVTVRLNRWLILATRKGHPLSPEQTRRTAMSTTEPRQASDIDRDIETLRDDELDAVTGGSFDLGNIVGSIAKAVLPLA